MAPCCWAIAVPTLAACCRLRKRGQIALRLLQHAVVRRQLRGQELGAPARALPCRLDVECLERLDRAVHDPLRSPGILRHEADVDDVSPLAASHQETHHERVDGCFTRPNSQQHGLHRRTRARHELNDTEVDDLPIGRVHRALTPPRVHAVLPEHQLNGVAGRPRVHLHAGEILHREFGSLADQLQTQAVHHYAGHGATADQLDDRQHRIGRPPEGAGETDLPPRPSASPARPPSAASRTPCRWSAPAKRGTDRAPHRRP